MLEWLKLRLVIMLKEKRQPMSKNEFLDNLRRYLSGEVPVDEIESNLRFYSDYISAPTEVEEARKIDEMGDPRLIAMNIVETYKMSHKIPHENRGERYEQPYEDNYKDGGDYNMRRGQTRMNSIKLKVMGALSVVIVIAFVILLIKAVSLALRLFLPVIIVFFLVFLFAGKFRKF